MASPLGLFTADWHVRKYDRVWAHYPTLTGDTRFAIQQIMQIARNYNVRWLLLGGDNFEEKIQKSDAIDLMRSAIDTARDAGIRMVYVQGQHELAEPPYMSAISGWPQHLHDQMVDFGGHYLYGLDYQRANQVEAALRAVPSHTDVLLTHQVWKNNMGEDRGHAWSHWLHADCFVLSGDFHHPVEATWRNAENHDIRFCSPGTICLQELGEPIQKRVVLINDDLTTTSVPLLSRGYIDLPLRNEQELQDAEQIIAAADILQRGVPDEIAKPILRVTYSANIPDVRRRIAAAVDDRAHIFWNPQAAILAEPVNMETAQRIQTVLTGGLPAVIRQSYNDDPAAAEIAIRLLDAVDPAMELTTIYQELTATNVPSA